jgi:restriction system protein
MSIPDYQSILLPLLQFTADGKEHRTRDVNASVSKYFNLTEEELSKLVPSGQDYVFGNRCGWARTYLKRAGLIQNLSWGKVQITEAGKSLLSQHPDKIDVSLLKQYPSFLEFWNGTSSTDTDQAQKAKEALHRGLIS